MNKDTKLIKLILDNLQKLDEKKKKLSKKQMKIAKAAPPPDEITGADFKVLNNKRKNKNENIEDVLESFINLDEKKKKKRKRKKKKGNITDYQSSQYGMKKKGKGRREKVQRRINKKLAQGKKLTKADYAARDAAEKAEREKPGWKNKPRPDTKISESMTKYQLQELISEAIEAEKLAMMLEKIEELEEKKKRKKKKKKKKGGGLSAAVKKSLDKKADRRGLTRGSVYSEFRKGLAAYYSSGSRKGMTAHQWAHARVNSANPSKSWAVVKKKKGGKKK